ncbi:beta-lactamase family protein [Myroides marinus]|nr:beta-lactamase family protein [Myroides marinus]
MWSEAKEETKQKRGKSFQELSRIVDQYANKTLQKGNINSLAIGIYRDGEVYKQYYGVLDSASKQKPNDDTLYEIASITKTFTGALVTRAVLERKISLDDDIRTYLKGDYPNLHFEGTPITIQNLLTHTLGLKDKAPERLALIYQGVREGKYENNAFAYGMPDLLEELKTVELDKKPGTLYEYNSVGPELLAYVLEQVYHKSYKDLVQDFLVELDLSNTHLYEYEKYREQLAISFDENGKIAPLLKNPLLGGSHGMISNLPDLIKFMQFQLENQSPFIKESSRLLFKDEVEGDDKGYLWDVGYGQKEGAYHGKTGTSNGVQSGILICPNSSYGMIVIMNNNSEAAQDDWVHTLQALL